VLRGPSSKATARQEVSLKQQRWLPGSGLSVLSSAGAAICLWRRKSERLGGGEGVSLVAGSVGASVWRDGRNAADPDLSERAVGIDAGVGKLELRADHAAEARAAEHGDPPPSTLRIAYRFPSRPDRNTLRFAVTRWEALTLRQVR
jgi:hypothetical protein